MSNKSMTQLTLVASSILLAGLANAGEIKSANSPTAIPGRYIVVYKDQATVPGIMGVASINALADQARRVHGADVRHTYSHVLKGAVMLMSHSSAQKLANDPNVAYVEADQRVSIVATQTGATWGIDRIDQNDLPLSGTYTYPASSGVHAYIIDTGMRGTHSEFSGRVGNGYDAINDGNGTNDCQGHGTHVAGTVGGTTWGVAKSVTLHPVRVLDCSGSGSNSGVIAGMDWVAQNAVHPAVANMSLGGGASQSTDDAVGRLTNAGVVTVVAAGNDSGNACSYSPARAPSAITVGSTTNTDAMSSFSNYGSCVDIYGPGSNITSSSRTSDTSSTTMSGTSMASPHLAGVAALYLAQNTSATVAQVTTALVNNASTGKITGIPSGANKFVNTVFLNGGTPPPPPPPPPPPGGTLSNGVPVTGLADSTGAWKYYTIVLPAGSSNLRFITAGGTGDADIYAKFGANPTTTDNVCKSESSTNAETCAVASPQTGTYHVGIYAYATYSGVSLTGSYSTGGGNNEVEPNNTRSAANTLANGVTMNGTIGSTTDTDYFKVTLSVAGNLAVTLAPNASADYDLYVYNSAGTQVASSVLSTGQIDSLNYSAAAGTYYIRSRYYSGTTGSSGTYTVRANW